MKAKTLEKLEKLERKRAEANTPATNIRYEPDLSVLSDEELHVLEESWRIKNSGSQWSPEMKAKLQEIMDKTPVREVLKR